MGFKASKSLKLSQFTPKWIRDHANHFHNSQKAYNNYKNGKVVKHIKRIEILDPKRILASTEARSTLVE